MKTSDVKVGGKYSCRVSGERVTVEVTEEVWNDRYNKHHGWKARNLKTGRTIRLYSPRRLRPIYNPIIASKHTPAAP